MTDTLAAFGFEMEVTSWLGFRSDDDGWEHYAYEVRLSRHGRSMTIPYRMGVGLVDDDGAPREPSLLGVMHSLASDSRIVEYDEFDDIVGDMPYSKARKLHDQLTAQVTQFRRLAGKDYQTIIDHEWDA